MQLTLDRSEVGCSEEFLLKKIPALCQRKLLDRKSLQSIHNEDKGVLYHQFTLSLHWFAKLNSGVIITWRDSLIFSSLLWLGELKKSAIPALNISTLSCIMMKNGWTYSKILRCEQRKIFELCLTIFHHHAWKA